MAKVEHELDAPPWHNVHATLMATSRGIRRAYDLRLKDLDLILPEASLLALAAERGALNQSQIAEKLGMGRARAGAVVDSLERRGLLARVPNPEDRRVWLVEATPAADPIVKEIDGIDRSLREELRKEITVAQRAQLAKTIFGLQQNLATIVDERFRDNEE